MCHVCVMLAGSDPAMSLPGVSPCYLYRNIWLIDWLQIINKTYNISTQCWWSRSIVTFQKWRRQFCHVTFSNINVLPMPLLTPRQRSPDQSEGENWLIDQWEASVMRVSWLRGRVGDSCGEAEGRANQSVHTLTSPHTPALSLVHQFTFKASYWSTENNWTDCILTITLLNNCMVSKIWEVWGLEWLQLWL